MVLLALATLQVEHIEILTIVLHKIFGTSCCPRMCFKLSYLEMRMAIHY